MIEKNLFAQAPQQPFEKLTTQLCCGDLLFCSGSGLISSLIKKATHSVFSHVAMILQLPISKQWLVLESVESVGVRCVTLQQGYVNNYMDTGQGYNGSLLIARHNQMDKKIKQFSALYHRAFALAGDKYSREDIFKIATRIATSEIGIHENGLVKENNRYICSEYVYACFKAVGIDLPYDPRGFIAPATIAQLDDVKPLAYLVNNDVALPQPETTAA